MGSSSSTPTKRPVVVIVGGGSAGMALAKKLDATNLFEPIVIDRRNHFFYPIASLRAAVQPSFTPQIVLPYDKALRNGFVVQGEVTQIDHAAKVIHIHGRNAPLRFDHLVIATGSSYSFPRRVAAIDATQAKASLDEFHSQLLAAKNILIVGGGAVGVELAGEIATDMPTKSVTIVHRGAKLAHPQIHPKHEASVNAQLAQLRVKVLLNESAAIDDLIADSELLYVPGARRVTTSSNKVIDTDLVIFATGPQINSSAYEHSASSLLGAVREHCLVVDEYFRVTGTQNVYALGDCALIETRLAFFAEQQALHLAGNLVAQARGKALKPYKAQPADKVVMFLSIGRNGGSAEKDGSVLPKWLITAVKSGSLFVGKKHELLNVKVSKKATGLLPSRGSAAVSQHQREIARLSLDVSSNAIDEMATGYPAKPVVPGQAHV